MTAVSLRFAARELRSGVRGFRIFLACLALGVAAIAAAGSTAEAFRQGLATQAREILGGDLAVSLEQRPFTAEEQAAIDAAGRTSLTVATRAMAQSRSGDRRLVELRGVAGAYPLYGAVALEGGPALPDVIARQGGAWGAAVERPLLDRLGLKLGDRFLVGNVELVATAVLLQEPDRLGRGFALGPRVLVDRGVLEEGGFLDGGLPWRQTARIALSGNPDLAKARETLKAKVGRDARVRDRQDAAPGVRWLIDQLEYFMGFIGLAALLAGGLGVSGAVGAFLEGRKPSIAVLKALGADGRTVRNVYMLQIGLLAALGVGIGVVLGALAPFVLATFIPPDLTVPALFAVYPEPLLRAAVFGLIAAAAFSLLPLARARATPPASLFRQDLRGSLGFSLETIGAALAFLGLGVLAILTAPTKLSAVIMMGGTAVAFGLLWGLGAAATRIAGRLRRYARGALRIGLANLAGPHSSARTASPAIGLGVALLTAVLLIQSSLLAEVTVAAPRSSPAIVFTEIPGDRTEAFDQTVAAAMGQPLTDEIWLRFPVISGRIVAVNGTRVDGQDRKEGRDDPWVFDNDLQMSTIGAEPPDARIVEGRWWSPDTAEPQVAMALEAARDARLKLGDRLTVSVLGVEVDATLSVLREVEFGSFSPSFTVVLSPATLAGAPMQHIALAKATPEQEARVTRALGAEFPQVVVISVREQLDAATALFGRLALAIRGAAAVALLAGLLVLAGALAANASARTREAAILRVLGASRLQVLSAYGLEYGAVGLIAAGIGVLLGAAAAWPVITFIFETEWAVDWTGVAALLAGAAAVTGAGGVFAAAQAMRRPPAPVLRSE